MCFVNMAIRTPANNMEICVQILVKLRIFIFQSSNNLQMINTFKYHVFAPMGRFQKQQLLDGRTVENKGKLILTDDQSESQIFISNIYIHIGINGKIEEKGTTPT